ncbi:MAG: hypothetical protein Q9168_004633 [Polycauliona sp. 1 TL-2023]
MDTSNVYLDNPYGGTGNDGQARRLSSCKTINLDELEIFGIEKSGNNAPGCPICRAPLLNGAGPGNTEPAQRDEHREEQWETDLCFREISNWAPGDVQRWSPHDVYIDHAEELWREIGELILNDLDDCDFSKGLHIALGMFAQYKAPAAARFLSFGTAFNFHQAYCRSQWRPKNGEHFASGFGLLYRRLVDHLESVDLSKRDEQIWRSRQAYDGSIQNMDYFKQRMESSRANLLKRAGEIRSGATRA